MIHHLSFYTTLDLFIFYNALLLGTPVEEPWKLAFAKTDVEFCLLKKNLGQSVDNMTEGVVSVREITEMIYGNGL